MAMAQEYEVEIIYDVAGEAESAPTKVETLSELVARVTVPPPPPVPLTRRERDRQARLCWVLDDLGLGIFKREILRRLEDSE